PWRRRHHRDDLRVAGARPVDGPGAAQPRFPRRPRRRLRDLRDVHGDQPPRRRPLWLARPAREAAMKAWVGIALTVAMVAGAVAAPWLAPVDPLASDFAAGLRPPGASGHPLGTDQLGRDLLARVLYGARLALFIGACTVIVTALVGGLLGLVAGFVERWPSVVLMRLADVQLSFPFILLAMTINAIVGLGLRNVILSLSAAGWVVYA